MKQKQKYTFYLNNTSRIVLTDEDEDFETISNKLSSLMNSKTIQAFGTNTDIIIVNPNKIDAIHVSKFDSNQSEYNNYEKISKENKKNEILEQEYIEDDIDEYEDDDTYKSDLNKGFDNSNSDFISDLVSENEDDLNEDYDENIEIENSLEDDIEEEETEKD